ncbi:unnamed protein product, partial [marine sediment metagenome]
TEVSDCASIGDSDNLMELEIEEITVSGLGEEDNEWVPLDEIEVEVSIENNNNHYKIEDIVVGWGLYNLNTQEWVFDEEESDFNIKDGDDKTLFFTFTLEDPDDFEEDDDFVFYVWAEGEDEEHDNAKVCRAVSEEIDVDKDASGDQLFNIEVLSEGETVMAQPVSVPIEKALLGSKDLLTALIVAISIILIIIIIILAVKVARK